MSISPGWLSHQPLSKTLAVCTNRLRTGCMGENNTYSTRHTKSYICSADCLQL